MLSEEALILLAVVGACALIILGVLELLWPTRPRHPVRHRYPPRTRIRRRIPRQVRPGRGARATAWGEAPSAAERTAEAPPVPAAPAARPAAPAPIADAPVLPEVAAAVRSEAPGAPAEALPVETCFALYQEGRFADVVMLGTEALEGVPAETAAPAHEVAALWSVVGLAQQALGEHERAGAALEAAIAAAPAPDRPTYQHHLAALALNVGQALLARAQAHASPQAEGRVPAIRAAVLWLHRGLAAVPSDAELREALAGAQAVLWPASEQVVHGLLQRQQFRAARRLLREALADESLPPSRAAAFHQLLSGTFGGEIGQLTAQAIRSMQETRESEAFGSLTRAEELLTTIPDEALPPKRREEVDRRLWWGYTKLGIRRVEAGQFEEALDPLIRALRFAGIGPERQEETRAALVRAVEGVADTRALSIRQLADEGDRDEAVIRSEKLWALLTSCTELGLSQDDLSVAFAKAARLFEQLGLDPHT